MRHDVLDKPIITEPEEMITTERSGVIALILGAISGGAVIGLIWLFSTLLS